MEFIPWLLAAYAVICAAAYFGSRLLMYFPDPTRIVPAEAGLDGVKEIEIAVAEGVTLVAWHAAGERRQTDHSLFPRQRGQRRHSCVRSQTQQQQVPAGTPVRHTYLISGSGSEPTPCSCDNQQCLPRSSRGQL